MVFSKRLKDSKKESSDEQSKGWGVAAYSIHQANRIILQILQIYACLQTALP